MVIAEKFLISSNSGGQNELTHSIRRVDVFILLQ